MNEKILEKIKKCLALSKSANEHEAALALKQAKALMDKYNVDEQTLAFSDVVEEKSKAKTKGNPPLWACGLADICAKAFGCELFFSRAVFDENYRATFVGIKHHAYLAGYAYEVLYRQLAKARKDYYAKNNKRCKRSTRIYRANQFAEGYVSRLYCKVADFASAAPDVVEQYMEVKHKNLSTFKHRKNKSASDGRAKHGNEDAFGAGWDAGKDAHLHHPVGGQEQQRLC